MLRHAAKPPALVVVFTLVALLALVLAHAVAFAQEGYRPTPENLAARR